MSGYFVSATLITYSGSPCGENDSHSTQKSEVKSARSSGEFGFTSTICLIDVANRVEREWAIMNTMRMEIMLGYGMCIKALERDRSRLLPLSRLSKFLCRGTFRPVCWSWKASRILARVFWWTGELWRRWMLRASISKLTLVQCSSSFPCSKWRRSITLSSSRQLLGCSQ